MFKHILLPIDGTPISDRAIEGCVDFAKNTGARITGLHVTPEFHAYAANQQMLDDIRTEYVRENVKSAQRILASIKRHAQNEGVACETMQLESDRPHKAIIEAAQQRGCDLITMATRGYTGIKSVLYGSETHKVLRNCNIPVLVFH